MTTITIANNANHNTNVTTVDYRNLSPRALERLAETDVHSYYKALHLKYTSNVGANDDVSKLFSIK